MIWLWIGTGAAVAVILIILFLVWSDSSLIVTTYEAEGPEELTVVQLTDMHGKMFGKGNRRLIKKVSGESPDVIFFTGDIIHRYDAKNLSAALGTVERLAGICPVFFVSGNHEMRSTKYASLRRELVSRGVTVLDDSAVTMGRIRICGLSCASLKNGKIFSVLDGEGEYKILLAHEPQYLDRYAEAGADLVFSGHAHGGQWRIPFTDIGFYAPGQGFFPKYTEGLYVRGRTQMIVSEGLGNSEFPIRLFDRPEIVVVRMKKKSRADG